MKLRLITLLALTLTASTGPLACRATSPASGQPAPEAQQATPLGAEEATAMCVKLHEQGAQCLEPFANLLLELRAKYDPRFAQALATPGTREEIQQAVRQETLADGTGPLEQRTQRCTEYAVNGPPVPASDPQMLERCYALSDCTERVACMRPVLETRFQARAAGQGR